MAAPVRWQSLHDQIRNFLLRRDRHPKVAMKYVAEPIEILHDQRLIKPPSRLHLGDLFRRHSRPGEQVDRIPRHRLHDTEYYNGHAEHHQNTYHQSSNYVSGHSAQKLSPL